LSIRIFLSENPDGPDEFLVVEHGFAHAHKHDLELLYVLSPDIREHRILDNMIDLCYNFAGEEISLEEFTGSAEGTSDGAP
jgi:hypothetical protein